MVHNYCVVKVLVLTSLFYLTNGSNFSPVPNLKFSEPNLKFVKNKTRSSYFGFAINLRKSSVIVGAPRAQSTLESQKLIDEPGAIYKCTTNASESCAPLIFEDKGNVDRQTDTYFYNSEKKDNQWLGAAIDGNSDDADQLIFCAPRHLSDLGNGIQGICYWTPNTLTQNVTHIFRKFTSLHKIDKNSYRFGEQGISVHITSDNKEIIIGAPGIKRWKGSVIRYHHDHEKDDPVSAPNVEKVWAMDDSSYFGYSIYSGNFNGTDPNKIFYVASAPQASIQTGEVFIFDWIEGTDKGKQTIKRLATLNGSQFGEYFGYAVLAEDINGDNFTDLIVTAPQYSSNGYAEEGAIYVFMNEKSFTFKVQKINSPVKENGRFGCSIAMLGDINRDGFNDIAVGAPFAGDGVVFIYLGSSEGLSKDPSQQLRPGPIEKPTFGNRIMFGHSLSKGVDIDDNGFNDIAIGAPNAESVFVYRAYPIVKIHATIYCSPEIRHDQTNLEIQICYNMSTVSTKINKRDIVIKVEIEDPKAERVKFKENNLTMLTFPATASRRTNCSFHNANVTFDIDHAVDPIRIKMSYSNSQLAPNSKVFCDNCAILDPSEQKNISLQIVFTTGCKGTCDVDLSIRSSGLNNTYILGNNSTVSVTYSIMNYGETAFNPEVKFTPPKKVTFMKIPPFCNSVEDGLLCKLNRQQPMLMNNNQSITIFYDISNIEESSLQLTAVVSSLGNETNPSDNKVTDFITLREFTNIEAVSKPEKSPINLEKDFDFVEILNNYQIRNSGPSGIRELEITFEIPIAHKFYDSYKSVPVINISNNSIQGVYYSDSQRVELHQYEPVANPEVTQKENHKISNSKSRQLALNNHYTKAVQNLPSNEFMESLPIDRTIVFSCFDSETATCANVSIKISNFKPKTLANLTLKYQLDLNEVNKVLIEPWEYFVIIPKFNIMRTGDLVGKTLNITTKMEYVVISKQPKPHETPSWLIIVAILGGLLVLLAIGYGMYKAGFFSRKIKKDMEDLIQEEQEDEEYEQHQEYEEDV